MEDNHSPTPDGAEFRAFDSDGDETEKSSDKKKKRSFSDVLNKLLPNQEENNEADANSPEGGRVNKVIYALKELFGRTGDVETDELPEEDDAVGSGPERPLRLPLLPRIGESPLNPVASEQTEVFSRASKVVEGADYSWMPVPTVEINETEVVDNAQIAEPVESNMADSFTEMTPIPDTERQTREVQEVMVPAEPVRETEAPRQEVIVQQRGHRAALAGFVAAETLSRHRDRKIRREARELKRQVDRSEKQQSREQEILTAQKRNAEQITQLQDRRIETLEKEAKTTKQEVQEVYVREPASTSEVKVERQAQPSVERKEVKPESQRAKPEVQPVQLNPAEKVEQANPVESTHITEELVRSQVEQAAERDVAIEAYYERRHEAKDVPTTSATGQDDSPGAGRTVTNDEKLKRQALIQQLEQEHQSIEQSRSMYSQAVKQGVWAGTAVVIALVTVALVWSLL